MKRQEILETAIRACIDRTDKHGEPEDSFAAIADLWEIYLGHKYNFNGLITPKDVAWMMCLLKVARSINNPATVDSYVDAAAYAALAAEL